MRKYGGRLGELVEAARGMTECGIPVVLIRPRIKDPMPSPSGGWWKVRDPDRVAREVCDAFKHHSDLNMSVALGVDKGSPIVALDVDGPAGVAKVQELGLSSRDDVWIQRTGSGEGHYHVIYRYEGRDLTRAVKKEGLPVDLLTNGFSLIPPSITKGRYVWITGPDQVDFDRLRPLPLALLEWWRAERDRPYQQHEAPRDRAWSLLNSPIGEGERNDKLTRLAGWLHRYHGENELTALLLAINEARCQPPLPELEVLGIVKSVGRYAVGGLPQCTDLRGVAKSAWRIPI